MLIREPQSKKSVFSRFVQVAGIVDPLWFGQTERWGVRKRPDCRFIHTLREIAVQIFLKPATFQKNTLVFDEKEDNRKTTKTTTNDFRFAVSHEYPRRGDAFRIEISFALQ